MKEKGKMFYKKKERREKMAVSGETKLQQTNLKTQIEGETKMKQIIKSIKLDLRLETTQTRGGACSLWKLNAKCSPHEMVSDNEDLIDQDTPEPQPCSMGVTLKQLNKSIIF